MANVEQYNKVVLGVRKRPMESDAHLQERIDELIGLCEAAGGQVVAVHAQERLEVDAALYLGRGKVAEIAQTVAAQEADLVIFDGELSPAQLRNLENQLNCRVIDRTQLILDIFALRARSKVGRLQVEVAQLTYLLPRLTGRGVEMSRLGGGIGTRGPGETRLEMDRRRIRQRMAHLRAQLKAARERRGVQRQRRLSSVPTVALVGYTNAGKTTLLQKWTSERGSSHVDSGHARLFDTLDPLARRVKAGAGSELVLLDTVGFVQELPHLLVDAFRATLEEVAAADVIVHVLDGATDPHERARTTYQVLSEIGALGKPIVTFYNKMDLCAAPPPPDREAAVTMYGSAATGEGLADLYQAVDRVLHLDPVRIVLEGPERSPSFWSDIARRGKVISAEPADADGTMRVTVEIARRYAASLQPAERSASGPPPEAFSSGTAEAEGLWRESSESGEIQP
ncbi:GTPase HflX [Alicyclobacillus cycloheptanicus]|uniref:GTPase HflX n=1 Tax=Alicyclobacillus cycloheptanicus TaxID=1457 RepID=A0ABT9XGU0_9BACL|nr:GTPase HflX [Alicyclobacillus cycloheptanicus]MDQ0189320.1 GTP-binding protein HflX [Alicyclobacillus cycloheptanicus]WDM01320.1 GTPase HflX [Alicyclobacillus cycloheptanicus]